jgi:hypothetical protein
MARQGYLQAPPHSAWLLPLSLLLCAGLSGCGGEQGGGAGAGQGAQSGRLGGGTSPQSGGPGQIGHIEAKPGHQNPVIVGEDLENLPGEAGEIFRKRREQRAQARKNNPWIQPVDIDLGKHRLGEEVKAVFEFQNPREQQHLIRSIQSSCSCQKLVLEMDGKRRQLPKALSAPIPIPPGAKGKIEAYIEIEVLGVRFTNVQLRIDDPELPFIDLQVQTQGVMDFIVQNAGKQVEDVFLGSWGMKEAKSFELEVAALDGKAFEITRVVDLPEGFHVRYKALGEDRMRWRVFGEAGPGLAEGSFKQQIRLETQGGKQVQFGLSGIVRAPFKLTPSFLSFGQVERGKSHRQSVQIESLEAGFSVEVARLEWVELTLRERGKKPRKLPHSAMQLELSNEPGFAKASIDIELPASTPAGAIKGTFRVHFKNTKVPPRIVSFNAFVR